MEKIPGILILNGNKTYGRNKKNKLLYKVIPNNKSIQPCLIPYEIKHLGFSKNLENLYVIFSLNPGEACDRVEPKLVEVIGCVSSNINFFEYQLYCSELKHSLTTFKNKVLNKLKEFEDPIQELNNKYNLESRICNPEGLDLDSKRLEHASHIRSSWNIFSIDPDGSKDFDDAFSIKTLPNLEIDKQNYLVSIYIANVPLWLDLLEFHDDINQVSTIYLPNKKQSMLPTILSDDKCSLLEKTNRIAFTLDLEVNSLGDIIDTRFSNTLVNLKKNWSYDDPKLLLNKDYLTLLKVVKKMSNQDTIDTHKLVEILMVKMNCICGKLLFENNSGIFRKVAFEENLEIPQTVPKDIANTIQIISNAKSSYIKSNGLEIRHDILQTDSYIHITSPIRRVVDIINMGLLQKILGLTEFSNKTNEYFNKMIQDEQINNINIMSKKIKSTQNKCNLLNWITLNYIPDTILEGYIIDECTIYIPEYRLQCKLPENKTFILFSKYNCKLFLFEDNHNLSKKIRVEIYA
jgi:exoribonuclease R